MSEIRAGKITIDVWQGGYPVWCVLSHDGKQLAQLHHSELLDLEYAVKRALMEARRELPEPYKDELRSP